MQRPAPSAQRVATGRSESAPNMDAVAKQGGFVVAYLNGTPVARLLRDDKLGWNAGACCGLPAASKVDDVDYIRRAALAIATAHGRRGFLACWGSRLAKFHLLLPFWLSNCLRSSV